MNTCGSNCSRLGHNNEAVVQNLTLKIMNMQNSTANRPNLGEFSSIVCFKSVITGKKLRGVHTESVLRGGTYDVFEFSVIE